MCSQKTLKKKENKDTRVGEGVSPGIDVVRIGLRLSIDTNNNM